MECSTREYKKKIAIKVWLSANFHVGHRVLIVAIQALIGRTLRIYSGEGLVDDVN